MKPPRILVNTLFTLFKRHSHPVHILLTKRTYLYINHGIRRREGMKEKKLLCRTFFRRFSASAGRFRPLIFSPRQTVSRHLAGKAHCNAGTATHQHARKTAPQCCKHRQLASPTKLKPFCMKFQIFHFTLTSLDFTRLHS